MTGTAQTREEPPPAILVDERTIGAHVERIAGQLTRDHPDGVVLDRPAAYVDALYGAGAAPLRPKPPSLRS